MITYKKKNNCTQIYGYTPNNWQTDAHKFIDEYKKNTIFVIKSKRQVGKSLFIINQVLKNSVENKNSLSIILSPTLTQSRKIYNEMCDAVINSVVYNHKNDSLLELTLVNNSKVLFKSAEQKENLRGFTTKGAGLLCIDEAAYISDEIFAMVLPFTNVWHSSIILTSTPSFKKGFFYNLYCAGLKKYNRNHNNFRRNIITIDVNDYDTSAFLPEDKKQMYREIMPMLQYKSEIEGEFIEEYSSVFGNFQPICNNNFDTTNNKYYFGVDWGTGSGKDKTAIAIFNSKKEMIKIDYFKDKDSKQTIDRIIELAKEYHPIKITCEENSIGKVFFDLLRKELNNNHIITNLVAFNTNNNSKNKLVNKLQIAIQNKDIQLLDDIELKLELSNYQVEQTKTGKLTYNASRGNNDDLVIATMIAFYSIGSGGNYCLY